MFVKPSFRIPFYVIIGTIFIVFTVGLVSLIAWNNYDESSKTALHTTRRLFNEITDKVNHRINRLLSSVVSLTDAASAVPSLLVEPEFDGLDHAGLSFLTRLLDSEPNAYSVFVGYDSGNFLQVIGFQGKSEIRIKYEAPDGSVYLIATISTDIDDGRKEYWGSLDENGRLLEARGSFISASGPGGPSASPLLHAPGHRFHLDRRARWSGLSAGHRVGAA